MIKKRTWIFTGVGVLALVGVGLATRGIWSPQGAIAQAPAQNAPRTVPVEVATATRKMSPIKVEALGTVTPIASVAIKSRLETEITAVHFADGAFVKEGDLLFTLDTRTIEAQVRQAEGQLARDKAQLEGAERDFRRYTELVAKSATPVTNLDNARTQADTFRAAIKADEAALENLKIQVTYGTIRAPISGRISAATVKVGNFVRPADAASLATIVQTAPIYITMAVPQRVLPDIRAALAAETATVEGAIPGSPERTGGSVTMIENTVDPTTGMATIRATMRNQNEALWPGTLVNTQITLRVQESVAVPTVAVQVSQTGTFVFVVKDGVATVRPVTVAAARGLDGETIIGSGLEDGEIVVTDGQLLLTNGTRVTVRERKAQS